MTTQYTISQLARSADVPSSTVRYYERACLLDAESRSAGNYRVYGNESLQRLKFIRAAQAVGFKLDDVRLLPDMQTTRSTSCDDVRDLIAHRLDDLVEQLKNLRHVQKVLKSALKRCDKAKRRDCCPVIESLQTVAGQ